MATPHVALGALPPDLPPVAGHHVPGVRRPFFSGCHSWARWGKRAAKSLNPALTCRLAQWGDRPLLSGTSRWRSTGGPEGTATTPGGSLPHRTWSGVRSPFRVGVPLGGQVGILGSQVVEPRPGALAGAVRAAALPRRCGCTPPPATGGRGHTATRLSAGCRRRRRPGSAGRCPARPTGTAGPAAESGCNSPPSFLALIPPFLTRAVPRLGLPQNSDFVVTCIDRNPRRLRNRIPSPCLPPKNTKKSRKTSWRTWQCPLQQIFIPFPKFSMPLEWFFVPSDQVLLDFPWGLC